MIFRDLIRPEEFYDGCKVYRIGYDSKQIYMFDLHSYAYREFYPWCDCGDRVTYANTGLECRIEDNCVSSQ
jgi:hypothetical protein